MYCMRTLSLHAHTIRALIPFHSRVRAHGYIYHKFIFMSNWVRRKREEGMWLVVETAALSVTCP